MTTSDLCAPGYKKNRKLKYLTFIGISGVYGGAHLGAWTYEFPTVVEMWMWRASGISLAAMPFIFIIIFYHDAVYRWIQGKKDPSEWIEDDDEEERDSEHIEAANPAQMSTDGETDGTKVLEKSSVLDDPGPLNTQHDQESISNDADHAAEGGTGDEEMREPIPPAAEMNAVAGNTRADSKQYVKPRTTW